MSGAPATMLRRGTPGQHWIGSFSDYRADRFTKLDVRTKRNHEVGFRLVGQG